MPDNPIKMFERFEAEHGTFIELHYKKLLLEEAIEKSVDTLDLSEVEKHLKLRTKLKHMIEGYKLGLEHGKAEE